MKLKQVGKYAFDMTLEDIKIETRMEFNGSYVQKIFDPIQTHAIYGIETSRVDEARSKLVELGARKLRVTKAGIK